MIIQIKVFEEFLSGVVYFFNIFKRLFGIFHKFFINCEERHSSLHGCETASFKFWNWPILFQSVHFILTFSKLNLESAIVIKILHIHNAIQECKNNNKIFY